MLDRICGPLEKPAPDTFRITLDRAWHPGGLEHKSAVQQALMIFPEHKEGKEQTIDFPAIPDVTNGAVSIKLEASSNAGLRVRFFVKDGPAEVVGNQLYFTSIPPRAKHPASVTVFADQLGNHEFQTAPMVERTFNIEKP